MTATAQKLVDPLPDWWTNMLRFRLVGPQRLPADASADLRWFCGRPPLAALPATGSVGGQLERAAALGLGPVPCRKCGGYWRADDNGEIIEWRDASGYFPSTRHFPGKPTYAQALATYRRQVIRDQKLTVVGDNGNAAALELVREEAAKHGLTVVTEEQFRTMTPHIPEELCDECKRCNGLRVVPRRPHARGEITAYPTGNSKPLGSGVRFKQETEALADGEVTTSGIYWDGLARWNRIDENLCRVGNRSEVARVALERYYEPDGPGWVLGLIGYRTAGLDALDPLTPEGQRAAGRRRGAVAEAYLRSLRNDTKSHEGAAAILAVINRQRAELLDAACALYNRVSMPVPE